MWGAGGQAHYATCPARVGVGAGTGLQGGWGNGGAPAASRGRRRGGGAQLVQYALVVGRAWLRVHVPWQVVTGVLPAVRLHSRQAHARRTFGGGVRHCAGEEEATAPGKKRHRCVVRPKGARARSKRRTGPIYSAVSPTLLPHSRGGVRVCVKVLYHRTRHWRQRRLWVETHRRRNCALGCEAGQWFRKGRVEDRTRSRRARVCGSSLAGPGKSGVSVS